MSVGPPISVLVLAPTPTHPTIQGNRQRIFDMCRAMQTMGAELTLLVYAVDGIDPAGARRMKEAWSNLSVVFPHGVPPRQTLVRYPAIDDWYDVEIGRAASRLTAEKRFDVCFVNYAWYSKIFDSIPSEVLRVIDTHDIFGGRAERFAEIGLEPEWYHTSAQQESIGLDRAEFALAIQEIEADVLRERTRARVHSVGYLSEPEVTSIHCEPGSKLKVGYIGSGNPFNVAAMFSLAQAFEAVPDAAEQVEMHVAGAVCGALTDISHGFIAHGIVESVPEFYDSVDVVVNPMRGGTGLKIKSLEALGFGKPLVATRDAMEGIQSDHDGHQLGSPADTVQRMLLLAREPDRLEEEGAIARRVFQAYRQAQLANFASFWSELEREVRSRRAVGETRNRSRRTQ